MRDFEYYAARERLESFRANAARRLTRQQRAQRRRIRRRIAAGILAALLLLLPLTAMLTAAKAVYISAEPQEARGIEPVKTFAEITGSPYGCEAGRP